MAPEPQEEVQDFVEFLLEKKVMRPKLKPGFDCGGSVRDLRDRYTAGLQHRIAGWGAGGSSARETTAQTHLISYLYEERENL